ncbi:MAG TPA: response regulator [Jatrophihabitans sp.]|jgi:response regulator of citrate/malate metabolism|uniref:response regulator n=1 Tax=Jatrophihabitans sp. TaxID=1932789 RepID=UPI002DFDAB81|nr:response regulator [Jatrophihabitans sp.]
MTPPPIRTLVVDDDYRVAAVHAAYVEKVDGFTVVGQAHTAAAALDAVTELDPDLVLMDVFLPDGDGLTVVRSLMDRARHPDVVVITAARDMSTVRTAMQLGAVHYLVKPFGFAALSERLSAYRRLHLRIAGLPGEADQTAVDELFGILRSQPASARRPAKGHSAPTLELVRNAVRTAPDAVSASDVAESIGISRATAQRYLSYLESYGVVRLQLRYGSTGRPEHRYSPA